MTQADRANAWRRSLDAPDGRLATYTKEPSRVPVSVPYRRPRRTVSAAESAAVLAEYNPDAVKRSSRGIPDAWPLCTCDSPTCPDRGLANGPA